MAEAFVWFHNNSDNPDETKAFYEKLLGWKPADSPASMTIFASEKGPFAGLGAKDGGSAGWVPYVQVEDVDAATKRAVKLGGTLIKEKSRGPAGLFSVVKDPGGAAFALWQKA